MEFISVLFYIFSAILIGAAFKVITARNPVHAALFLVLAFFNAAALWLLLQAEFLAVVLVLVYVGAVMVLFLFVVMMLDINKDDFINKIRAGFWNHFPLAATVGVIIVLEMAMVLMRGFWTPVGTSMVREESVSNTKELGLLLYTQYIYAFEIAAAVLLVGIVAAVVLTLRKRKDTKQMDPALAVKVNSRDRVRIVRMQSESNRNVNNVKEEK